MRFSYYHSQQSEQFTFYRIPKALFTDEQFSRLSSDSKVLYGLMLDRMAYPEKMVGLIKRTEYIFISRPTRSCSIYVAAEKKQTS